MRKEEDKGKYAGPAFNPAKFTGPGGTNRRGQTLLDKAYATGSVDGKKHPGFGAEKPAMHKVKKPNIPGIKSKITGPGSPVADPSLGTLLVGGKRTPPGIPSRTTTQPASRAEALKRRMKKGIVSQEPLPKD